MVLIVLYLVGIGLVDGILLILTNANMLPAWWLSSKLIFSCGLVGGIGGVTYCLRGVYLNACVKKQWDSIWKPWYFIRPIVSHLCGAVSFLFLKAGLLLLESEPSSQATEFGFLALAFIAGLNVDKFITKIEGVAQATWGIEKSRTAKEEKNK